MSFFRRLNKQQKKETQPAPASRSMLSPAPQHYDELFVLPLKDTVIFPGTMVPVFIDRREVLEVLREAFKQKAIIGAVALKNNKRKASAINLYLEGTSCKVNKIVPVNQQGTMVVLEGLRKISILEFTAQGDFIKAKAQEVLEEEGTLEEDKKMQVLYKACLSSAQKIITFTPYLPPELQMALEGIESPLKLVYMIATVIKFKLEERQRLLEISDLKEKLKYLSNVLARELDLFETGAKIQSDVRKEFNKSGREVYLRQQLKAIKKELGEKSESETEASKYEKRLKNLKLPEAIQKEIKREIERLSEMNSFAMEYQMVRTYLDWVLELPWSKESKEELNLSRTKRILNEDHYGLKEVKERILEYLAVRKLKPDHRGPILCLVGPPGVGKTSLGQSIARALNREFVRMSLGGLRDEAEIRGHRRTYIGALPGRIVQGIRRAGSKNPIFMLDEVDKVGTDFRGDPASALLEVLDPEQNRAFRDHYIDLDFDLSKVMFITTANTLEPIQPALRDRMEVIKLPGYTLEEKLEIAKHHLIPRLLKEHGITQKQLNFADEGVRNIIAEYTQEAGVRQLERELSKICRRVAKKLASTKEKGTLTIDKARVTRYLGPQKVFPEVGRRVSQPGVATGLAWTQAGGDIIFVEATSMPGKKGFAITGQLGDIMKESAQAALSLVRSRAKQLHISEKFFESVDIHLHIPEGATPKDGPSAGVTMTTALASLLTKTPVRKDVGMSGEITLSGLILPIGGVKEKVLAARRAGLSTVILPKRNRNDLKEIEKQYLQGLNFVFAEKIDDVLKAALDKKKKTP